MNLNVDARESAERAGESGTGPKPAKRRRASGTPAVAAAASRGASGAVPLLHEGDDGAGLEDAAVELSMLRSAPLNVPSGLAQGLGGDKERLKQPLDRSQSKVGAAREAAHARGKTRKAPAKTPRTTKPMQLAMIFVVVILACAREFHVQELKAEGISNLARMMTVGPANMPLYAPQNLLCAVLEMSEAWARDDVMMLGNLDYDLSRGKGEYNNYLQLWCRHKPGVGGIWKKLFASLCMYGIVPGVAEALCASGLSTIEGIVAPLIVCSAAAILTEKAGIRAFKAYLATLRPGDTICWAWQAQDSALNGGGTFAGVEGADGRGVRPDLVSEEELGDRNFAGGTFKLQVGDQFPTPDSPGRRTQLAPVAR